MRAFMIVSFATMLLLSAWANNMDTADAGQTNAQSATAHLTEPGY
jgi:hypothetical protein